MAVAQKMDIMEIDISEIPEVIQMAINLKEAGEDINLLFHGSPGIGKTQSIFSSLQKAGYTTRLLGAPTMDPVDIGGFPMINVEEKTTGWAPPTALVCPPGEKLAIFVDEINRASTMVQNSLLSMFQERRVRDFKLDPSTLLIAAANREQDDVGLQQVSRAMNNRFIHIYVRTSITGFLKYAIGAGIHPAILGCLKFRPDLLNPAYDDSSTEAKKEAQKWKNEKAFPTPRAWETVSKLMNKGTPNRNMLTAMVAGTIGYGPTIEVMAYWDALNSLPSIDSIFLNPDTAKLPEEPSQCYAVSIAIARRMDDENLERGIQYLKRMGLEYNVLTVKETIRKNEKLVHTNAYLNWAIEFDGKF